MGYLEIIKYETNENKEKKGNLTKGRVKIMFINQNRHLIGDNVIEGLNKIKRVCDSM